MLLVKPEYPDNLMACVVAGFITIFLIWGCLKVDKVITKKKRVFWTKHKDEFQNNDKLGI